ncbi:MAG TPA: heparan-alpha-glucosaminide N-acetyltransferase domain-containing protein [Candidatus Binatia bacterium]|nr:heparan-alpha-glucosaminide N-acetyltransferase domain-containing protein [Candidatus Binatia bacterium]
MPPSDASKARLAYIDWMRGLACLLMFQTHCYDAWLGPTARQSRFFMYSQLGGTFPAPLFLLLAGISFALVTGKLLQKNLAPSQIARSTIRRGAEIFGFGLLFRLQEYLISWGWAPKSDLLRVDILNTIGLSMMLMGGLCWIVLSLVTSKLAAGNPPLSRRSLAGQGRDFDSPPAPVITSESSARSRAEPGLDQQPRAPLSLALAAISTSLLISLLTPLLWTTWRPRFLPWPLESYINGVHNLGTPQPWLFPIFPWAAFAFTGLAVGFVLQSPWTRTREPRVFISLGVLGVVLIELSRWLDSLPVQIYPVYDYWHTSPNFFLIRVGMLLVILAGTYAWCRWGLAQWGFSPLIQLGQASLLVYWVHIEFVYGRFSILTKHAQTLAGATVGLVIIFLSMLALAYVRTHAKHWLKALQSKPQLRLSS